MNGIRVTIWVKTCNIYSVNRQRYLTCVIVCISVKVYTDKNVIETAVDSLWDMAEFEPETHDALVDRMDGIHAATSVGEDEYFPDDLPHMFRDWREYRNFLLEKLVDNEEHYKNFKRVFRRHDLQAEHLDNYPSICRTHCRAILANDHENESILPDLKRGFDNTSTQKIRDFKIQWLKQNDKWEEIA